MKKKVLTLATVLLLGFFASCEDPYQEIATEELIELPASDDEEDIEAKPGDNEKNTGS